MSVEIYECSACGAKLGIAGENSGSPDDFAADDYFASEVEYHESGQCASVTPKVEVTPEPDPRAEYIAGLRALADLLEAEPTLALPHTGSSASYARLAVFTDTKEQLQAWARAIPGRKDKDVTESDAYGFELRGSLRGLHFLIYGRRAEVCERIVTGTREVTRTVPAPDAPMVEITETVEDVEWICSPLLAEDCESEAVAS